MKERWASKRITKGRKPEVAEPEGKPEGEIAGDAGDEMLWGMNPDRKGSREQTRWAWMPEIGRKKHARSLGGGAQIKALAG